MVDQAGLGQAGGQLIAEATNRGQYEQDAEHAPSGDGPSVKVCEASGPRVLLLRRSRELTPGWAPIAYFQYKCIRSLCHTSLRHTLHHHKSSKPHKLQALPSHLHLRVVAPVARVRLVNLPAENVSMACHHPDRCEGSVYP